MISPLGAAVGLMMGSVGAGGSLLAIPILVYLADQSPRAAQAGALVIVLAAAATGLVTHLRAGEVRWRAGLAFGAAAGAGSLAGSVLSRSIDPDLLLLCFSPVMLAGAAAMVSERAGGESTFKPWRHGVTASHVARILALGAATGTLIGIFGVGGGFVIVPVLAIVLGFGIAEAIGTSLLVIVIGGAFALGERLGSGEIDWGVTLPFAAAAIAGSWAGAGLADRADANALRRIFAAIVVVAAAYVAANSAIALL